MSSQQLTTAIQKEIDLYMDARRKKIQAKCFHHLGRAHILSQKNFLMHMTVHFIMLLHAFSRRDFKEIKGQFLRLLATGPGHLFKRLPMGNIGWATVSMFKEMDVPADLKKILAPAD